jgi:mannose-6-phosphate isomerase-like protein (cupin superfamily)
MKRVVTGVDEQGLSYILSDDVVEEGVIWRYRPEHIRDWIAGIDPDAAADKLEPPGGGATWAQTTIAPGISAANRPGIDDRGFHTTRTIDFVYVLEGELTLELDRGKVELQKGDFVVQQATHHAWHNASDEPAKILALMHKPSS